METRELKISENASGGTAAAGAKTYRITLPSSWVKKLDLDHADAKEMCIRDSYVIGTDFYKTHCNMPTRSPEKRTIQVFYSHDPLAKAAKLARCV